MKRLMYLSLFMGLSIPVMAQSQQERIIMTVNTLFDAMKKADTILLKNCFSPNAVLQTIQDKDGAVKVIDEELDGFIKFVGQQTQGAADEQVFIESVKIDGPLAMVWTPYKFYYKGKFSHCGVNCFQLVMLNSVWKIQYLIDTRRKDSCL